MIVEWDKKQTFLAKRQTINKNKNGKLAKHFRSIKYKRGIVWKLKDNPTRQWKNLQRFLKGA